MKNKPESTTSFASYNVPRRMVIRTNDELGESIGRRQVGLLMVGYADARFANLDELKAFNSNTLIDLWRTTSKTVVDVIRDKTQSEVAAELGVSQVQVSRLESKILARIREKLE